MILLEEREGLLMSSRELKFDVGVLSEDLSLKKLESLTSFAKEENDIIKFSNFLIEVLLMII